MKQMITNRLLPGIRDYLMGESGCCVFRANHLLELPEISRVDFYIHIPFCRSLCPYCPYNRVFYDKPLAARYLAAVLAEIDAYHNMLGSIEVGSVYVGGGTPTSMIDELGQILGHLRNRFLLKGEVGVETMPGDLDDINLRKLKKAGVNMLSVGVQSFDERYLRLIGRNYRADSLQPVLKNTLSAGFDAVNVDLMFALPGQSTAEAVTDLDAAIDLGAEQVTLYPLFTFPYSAVGRHLGLQRVRFPGFRMRRKMYKTIHDHAVRRGFKRVSVWNFKAGGSPRFSSVTRDHYIGIGAGSGTCLPGRFHFNTFPVHDYIDACLGGKMPVAIEMDLTRTMELYYWLYWRLYETRVPKLELAMKFEGDARVRRMFQLAMMMGLVSEKKECFELTERGSFWIHLLQNYYILNYIDKVWSTAMQEPWPKRIEL